MICLKCKKTIPEDSEYCSYCGAKQKLNVIEKETNKAKSQQAGKQETDKKTGVIGSVKNAVAGYIQFERQVSEEAAKTKQVRTGKILVIVGAILCVTIIGAVLGIPFIYWGLKLMKWKRMELYSSKIREKWKEQNKR